MQAWIEVYKVIWTFALSESHFFIPSPLKKYILTGFVIH